MEFTIPSKALKEIAERTDKKADDGNYNLPTDRTKVPTTDFGNNNRLFKDEAQLLLCFQPKQEYPTILLLMGTREGVFICLAISHGGKGRWVTLTTEELQKKKTAAPPYKKSLKEDSESFLPQMRGENNKVQVPLFIPASSKEAAFLMNSETQKKPLRDTFMAAVSDPNSEITTTTCHWLRASFAIDPADKYSSILHKHLPTCIGIDSAWYQHMEAAWTSDDLSLIGNVLVDAQCFVPVNSSNELPAAPSNISESEDRNLASVLQEQAYQEEETQEQNQVQNEPRHNEEDHDQDTNGSMSLSVSSKQIQFGNNRTRNSTPGLSILRRTSPRNLGGQSRVNRNMTGTTNNGGHFTDFQQQQNFGFNGNVHQNRTFGNFSGNVHQNPTFGGFGNFGNQQQQQQQWSAGNHQGPSRYGQGNNWNNGGTFHQNFSNYNGGQRSQQF